MPGEFEKQRGCLMIWPVRPGSWPYSGLWAKPVFAQIAGEIAKGEEVYMLTDEEHEAETKQMLPPKVHVLVVDSDDAWARDVGPTFVTDGEKVRGVNWNFNAWGGTYDGLYAHWEKDQKVAGRCCELLGYECYDASPFVLEGGSVHSDGEGTVMVTESCLLSQGRNPELSREQIEEKLRQYLGAKKVFWLPHGILGDETNEHVDNICAFVKPGEVVLAWTEDPAHPQYEYSQSCFAYLQTVTDAKGRKPVIHKMPMPKNPVCVKREDLEGYRFEEGEDIRSEGEVLAASYINFYIANHCVLVPQFDDPNDGEAVRILAGLFPEREIVPVYAREIIVGGGNIHCITQQIPAEGR